jgi:hypothetical protein
MSAEFAGSIDAPTVSLGLHPMKGIKDPQEVFGLAS